MSSVNYQGYLSVELVAVSGQTLWSYLVTPSRFSMSGVVDDLADQVVSHLLSAVAGRRSQSLGHGERWTLMWRSTERERPFLLRFIKKWFESSGQTVSYDANGSEAGLQMLAKGNDGLCRFRHAFERSGLPQLPT